MPVVLRLNQGCQDPLVELILLLRDRRLQVDGHFPLLLLKLFAVRTAKRWQNARFEVRRRKDAGAAGQNGSIRKWHKESRDNS